MAIALRAFIIGFALATALYYWIDPPIPVLIIALIVGHVIGFASAYFGEWLEWALSKFDDK
jgi:hypothetical protein